MSSFEDGIWISWEDHRRSRVLARKLNVLYSPLLVSGPRYKRYFILGFSTAWLLIRSRPKFVFCQNPSMVLATLVLALRTILRYKVIVDRHSNFKFEYADSWSPKWKIFHYLSRLTIKKADLTIVTNKYLNDLCLNIGGRSLILQDKIPDLTMVNTRKSPDFMSVSHGKHHIMAVTMFDDDEPIDELVLAGKALPEEYVLFLTGNYRKMYSETQREELISHGVMMTGFIDEGDYQSLMYHSDVVIVLTKKDHILNCGAYEAYSMRKPLVLSDTASLRGYFKEGCLYTHPNVESIEKTIRTAVEKKEALVSSMNRFVPELKSDWEKSFDELKQEIERI